MVLPEFVVEGFWEKLLHNQSALALKFALLNRPATALVNVPYHLTDPDDPDSTSPEIDARGRVTRRHGRRLARTRLSSSAVEKKWGPTRTTPDPARSGR